MRVRRSAALACAASFFAVAGPRIPAAHAVAVPAPIAISVKTEGVYRLTYDYLQAQGFHPEQMVVASLGLTNDGNPVPIFVYHGSLSGPTLVANDYVEFYAHPLNNTYSDTNVYVLTDDGSTTTRVTARVASAAYKPVNVATSIYRDAHRGVHVPLAPGAPAYTVDDTWPSDGDAFWKETDVFTTTAHPSSSATFSFAVPSPDATGTCSISVPVTAQPDTFWSGSPQHQLSVSISGTPVTNSADGTTSFIWTEVGGTNPGTTALGSFPCSALGGTTTGLITSSIKFGSQLQTGVQVDEVFPQTFSILYREDLCAVNDQLTWIGKGGGSYSLTGFDTPFVDVWRLSGNQVTLLGKTRTVASTGALCGGAAGYTLSFRDPLPGKATYFATAAPLVPASMRTLDQTDIASGLSSSAQYLIISPPQFDDALAPLVAYHQNQGLTVKVVALQPIYDQYSRNTGGFVTAGDAQFNPEAIRAYIDYAHQHLGTQYVLLVGGDTFDYHNFYNCPKSAACASANPSNQSVMPSLYATSAFTAPVTSDNLYGVPPGAGSIAPDVALGRMPVFSAAQLAVEVNKSVSWSGWVQSYAHTATFASGFGTPGNYMTHCADTSFPAGSDGMAADLPGSFTVTKDYEDGTHTDDLTNSAKVTGMINAGQEIVNYVGHGNQEQWSCLPMLKTAVLSGLTNSNKPAAVFQWGCQSAEYAEPRANDIDAALMAATDASGNPTGAVVTIGSTGEDLAQPQTVMGGGTGNVDGNGVAYFYGYLARGDSVGLSLQEAKDGIMAAYGDQTAFQDVVASYTLFGDPALTLPM